MQDHAKSLHIVRGDHSRADNLGDHQLLPTIDGRHSSRSEHSDQDARNTMWDRWFVDDDRGVRLVGQTAASLSRSSPRSPFIADVS